MHLPFFVVRFTRLIASFVAALHPQHHITPQATSWRVCVCRRLLMGRLPPCPAVRVGSALLCPKSRKARKSGQPLTFSLPFHARSPPLHCAGSAPFPSCGGGSIAATPPHRSSQKENSASYIFFLLRCLGVFDCPTTFDNHRAKINPSKNK